jgi:hypothetical protein
MAAKKVTRSTTRKSVSRAKATKKTSVRSNRKAPGKLSIAYGGPPREITTT